MSIRKEIMKTKLKELRKLNNLSMDKLGKEKSSVNLYVNSIELKKYKLSKRMMIGKTMSGQHRIFGKSDQHKLRQSALKKRKNGSAAT